MSLTPQQRRTQQARESFLAQFETPDERREHMRQLGQRSAASRLTLNKDEREALGAAYRLLGDIARRHNLDKFNESEAV